MNFLITNDKNYQNDLSLNEINHKDYKIFFDNNNLIANISRGAVNLNDNNIQINFEYLGALEETRQHLAGHFEYNTHQGTLNIVVHTFRTNENLHNTRLGQVRRLLLNHYNGLSVLPYDGGTYTQAPFEDCTQDTYNNILCLSFRNSKIIISNILTKFFI